MSDHRPTCGTCRWWLSSDPTWGRCHALPPTPGDTLNDNGSWALTYSEDWCGQHKLKPKEKDVG